MRIAFLLTLLAATLAFAVPRVLVAAFTDTEYAAGYSEAAFDSIAMGESRAEVLRRLGPPLSTYVATPHTSWLYCGPNHPGFNENGGLSGTFSLFEFDMTGRVGKTLKQAQTDRSNSLLGASITTTIGTVPLGGPAGSSDPWVGKTQAEVQASFGLPDHVRDNLATEVLIYSRSPSSTHYLWRRIGLDASGAVVEKQQFFWWD